MAIIPDIIREHTETDLSTEALQTLIDAAYADVDAIAGPLSEITKDYTFHYWATTRLHLLRPAASITEIQEGPAINALTTVASTDYTLLTGGWIIERHNQGWRWYVRVRYIPVQDVGRRDGVVIDLVKLALQYQGVQSENAGDYSATHPDYAIERSKLLGRLITSSRVVV